MKPQQRTFVSLRGLKWSNYGLGAFWFWGFGFCLFVCSFVLGGLFDSFFYLVEKKNQRSHKFRAVS